jgi:HK97 gp10 family phage protein
VRDACADSTDVGAKLFQSAAKAAAPVSPVSGPRRSRKHLPGTLKRNIRRRRLSLTQVVVHAKRSPAFYAHFTEKGTKFIRARHWMLKTLLTTREPIKKVMERVFHEHLAGVRTGRTKLSAARALLGGGEVKARAEEGRDL